MYRVFFSFMFIGFLSVCGQRMSSPCPEYFDFKCDATGEYGMINVKSSGPVSSLLLRANFTIATRLPSTYAGNILPIGSELFLLQEYNRGTPIQYRVNFPVTSPLPKLTSITVNDNVVCYGTGDLPGEAQYVSTISLQHTLFFKSGNDGLYAVFNNAEPEKPPKEEVVYVIEVPQSKPTNAPNNVYKPNYDKTTEEPRTTTTFRRPTTKKPTEIFRPKPEAPQKQGLEPNTLQNDDTSNSIECGISGTHDPVALIYKGNSYERGEWPWLVALYKQKFSTLSYICSGTLVSERHVVTAAHCMHRKSTYTAQKNIVVKAGVYNLEDWSDDIVVTRKVLSASIHDSYNSSTLANDILLLTLDKIVPLGSYIKPACLWRGNTDLKRIVGTSGVVAGWGANEMGPGGKGEPRMVHMPIVSTATCRASKPEFHKLTSTKTLCAGDRTGSGPCLGDSGGGLYILDNGRWRLRGVVSLSLWSENGESTCNLDDYVVFTDTAQYLPWIKDIMSNSDR